MTALATFLAHRAADAGFYCPACRSRGLDAEDMALSGSRLWTAAQLAAASARYPAPICNGCIEDFVTTEDGMTVHRDDTVQDAFGGLWADANALADAEAEAVDRRMYAGWR